MIGRQFGSGGRTIGKIVASRLGLDYYDSEITSEAARSIGVDIKFFEKHDEQKPSPFRTILQGAYGIPDNFHSVPLTAERVYEAQCQVIREFAAKGSCVIVGRNADFILRDHPNLFSVFLHSPIERRIKRILDRKEAATQEEAIELARQHDKRRERYYNFYSGDRKWGLADNYHLCLDTSLLNNESTADLIISVVKSRFGLDK